VGDQSIVDERRESATAPAEAAGLSAAEYASKIN
jgi:hypothetical protein